MSWGWACLLRDSPIPHFPFPGLMNLIPSFQSIMSISPEIRDQAYQFFIEEAPELLQMLESGLLTLSQERSTAKVHDLMRAAHSLKGGAASVELHAIKTIAHRLEDIFKALYSDDVVIDTTLESLLLQAYDCLRLPLMEQITAGDSDPELALETAEPIFTQLEAQLGDAMAQAENFIPSSSDLGIDMVLSIFDVDVGQGLERLRVVLANPQEYEVAGELRAQAEVFEGFAELLDLPGFGATAQATLKALDTQPDEAVLITQLALADFQTARDAVLAGERAEVRGPSVELVGLGDSTIIANFDSASAPATNPVEAAELDWEELEPATLPVDQAAALEAFDVLLGTASDAGDRPQALAEEMLLRERDDAELATDAESLMTSLEDGLSADVIPLIEDSLGNSEMLLTKSSDNLSPSPVEIDPLTEPVRADQLEKSEDSYELISQQELPLESSTDFTLDAANSKLDELFGDLAAESEAADAVDIAPEIETSEGMTDYVDIIIPANSTVDAASSEPTIPESQAVLNNSEVDDAGDESAAPPPLEGQSEDIHLSQNILAEQESRDQESENQESENQESEASHKNGFWILDSISGLISRFKWAPQNKSEIRDDVERESAAPPPLEFLDGSGITDDAEFEPAALPPQEFLDEFEMADDAECEPAAQSPLEVSDESEILVDWGSETATPPPQEILDESQNLHNVESETAAPSPLEGLDEPEGRVDWGCEPAALSSLEFLDDSEITTDASSELAAERSQAVLDESEITDNLESEPAALPSHEFLDDSEIVVDDEPESAAQILLEALDESENTDDWGNNPAALTDLEVRNEYEIMDVLGSELTAPNSLEVQDDSQVVDVGGEPISLTSLEVLNESTVPDDWESTSTAPTPLEGLNESEVPDDWESELTALTPLEGLNESAIANQPQNSAPVQQQEFQTQTTVSEASTQAADSEVFGDNRELTPERTLSLEPSAEFTLDAANSELDEIFDDLAAAPEVDAAYEAYEAPAIEAQGITDYVDIIIPANSMVDPGSESVAPPPVEILNESGITDQLESSASVQQYDRQHQVESPETLAEAVCSVEQIFESLPPVDTAAPLVSKAVAAIGNPLPATGEEAAALNPLVASTQSQDGATKHQGRITQTQSEQISAVRQPNQSAPAPKLSVRVDFDRLRRMDNLLGELAINRNGLSLQNEQLQRSVRELLHRFAHFQHLTESLRDLSDQMLIAPERHPSKQPFPAEPRLNRETPLPFPGSANFDALELDNYGALHGLLQEFLEEVIQLEESVGDIDLFAGQSNQMLEVQRQRMTQLRNELMWARMLPLGGVLNRFPRMLRDLSATHHKPVDLKISGAGVLVDKAILEKLYTPLLHLLRNAFDHGIEDPVTRLERGKAEQGQIEIRAYHQGNMTVIEVRDDGRGLDLEKIGRRAVELRLLSADQLALADKKQLSEFIFSPGFSTAPQVSELSGRGVGLDVVRSQLRSLKGTISVTPFPGQGTTFTLRLPLTLTVAKLLISLIGSTALAIPSDSIEEIVIPKANQIKQSGSQRLLYWQNQLVPVYPMAELLDYAYPLPDTLLSRALSSVPTPQNWALPVLIMRQDQSVFALEVERLVTEQELVIKPFGAMISAPIYTYGCTILGDGALVPVIDGPALVEYVLKQSSAVTLTTASESNWPVPLSEDSASAAGEIGPTMPSSSSQTLTILVVDDSAALRRTLALTLQKAGYRVLQARDGQEALDQLHQNSMVKLIICDIEMPTMNGFEFLSQRRQDPQLKEIPVAMLTSRGNPKHRRLAMHLGANQYFTKPYIEQAFLVEVRNMLEQKESEAIPVLT